MPNRYEREIEDILRNLEQTEPKQSLGQKLSGRLKRKADYRTNIPKQGFPSLNLSISEWLLLTAVIAALIAGGYAYAQAEPSLFTGIVALIGALCLILVVLLPFFHTRRSTQSSRYGNVTPLRRSPFDGIRARWNIIKLRLRYRRNRGDHT